MFVVVLGYGLFDHFGRLSGHDLVIFGGIALASILVDYLSGIFGARLFGASVKGTLGGLIGSLVGLVIFPPLGIFIGLIAGVLIAELYFAKKTVTASSKASAGALIGVLAGIIINCLLALTFITIFIISYWK